MSYCAGERVLIIIHDRFQHQYSFLIYGRAGTGKSQVIKAFSEWLTVNGLEHLLVRAATQGSAASQIDGATLHRLAAISPMQSAAVGRPQQRGNKQLQDMWG